MLSNVSSARRLLYAGVMAILMLSMVMSEASGKPL
jgi:hypothetical protein